MNEMTANFYISTALKKYQQIPDIQINEMTACLYIFTALKIVINLHINEWNDNQILHFYSTQNY